MKEKIFSLNWALLESPFSITCVCVLGMGQLGSEEPDSLVRSRPLCTPAHTPSALCVGGRDRQLSQSPETRASLKTQARLSVGVWELRGPRAARSRHPPVVEEDEHDRVPGVAGRRRPALGQDHLEVAVLVIESHLDLDVVAGGHGVIPGDRGVPDKQLHLGDKITGAVEVLDNGVNPARAGGLRRCTSATLPFPLLPRKQPQRRRK